MATLGTVEKVREAIGLDPDQAPDSKLTQFLTRARSIVLRDVSAEIIDDDVVDENLSPATSASTAFFTNFAPLADRDLSGAVTIADIDVFFWTDRNDPGTKVQLTSLQYNLTDSTYGRITF